MQVQRFNPVSGRLLDTGWPAVTQRSVGTFDRSGFILDARLRRSQIEQAARYLGYGKHPWVLTRGQFEVIPSRTFRQFLRTDLLAPTGSSTSTRPRFPRNPNAAHLPPVAQSRRCLHRTHGGRPTRSDGPSPTRSTMGPVRCVSRPSISVDDGVITSGVTAIRGPRGQMDMDVDNHAKWSSQAASATSAVVKDREPTHVDQGHRCRGAGHRCPLPGRQPDGWTQCRGSAEGRRQT